MTLDLDPAPGASPAPPRRGPPGLVLASAILSAALASGGTAAILLATGPTATPASTASNQAPAAATLASHDIGEAIAAVAAAAAPSVVTIAPATGDGAAPASGGSGIILSTDGLILTTTIVAPTDTSYTVILPDQREATARVAATDSARGLVLLDAAATGLTPARLAAADDLRVGQLVVALGSPLGELSNTVTQGIVSALDRSVDLRDPSTRRRVTLDGLIQTDAAINAGSSGGPLLDVSGSVVGVIATPASDGQGIGFAIPIAAARNLVAGAATH